MMGGAYFEVGNITPAAEFNIYVDPEAADVVLRSGVDITMMPLDVTHQVQSTRERIAAIKANGNAASIDVEAFSDVTAHAFVVTIAAGVVGIGAAIVISTTHAPTSATFAPRTVLSTTGDATVGVTANGEATVQIIGVTAGVAAVSVLYARATMTGASKARSIGDGSTFTARSLSMPGVGHHNVDTDVDQFGIAGVGVGGVYVYAEDSTSLDVYIGPAAGSSHTAPLPTVVTTTGTAGAHMSIDFSGPVHSKLLSLTIGLLASINGTLTTVLARQTARAYIGDQASLLGIGSVLVENTSSITAKAEGTGVGAGLGVSLGAALVTAILTPTVGAYGVGGAGTITGSDITFRTHLNLGFAGDGTADATVLLGSAALGAGIAAADVLALDSPTVTTGPGNGTIVTATGAVTLGTDVFERAFADGTSIGIGLGAGAGATLVDAVAGGCAPHHSLLGIDLPYRAAARRRAPAPSAPSSAAT